MAFVDTIRTLFGLVSDGPEPLKRARRKRKQPDEGADDDDDDGSDGEAQPQYRRRRRTLRIRRPSVTSFAAAPRNRVHGGAKAGAGVGAGVGVTSTIASVPDSRRGGGGDGATGATKTSSGVDTGVVQHLRRHKDMNAFGLRQSTYMRQQRVRYGLPPTLALPEDASSDVEGSPESQASPSSRPAIDWTPAPSAAPQRVDTTPRPQGQRHAVFSLLGSSTPATHSSPPTPYSDPPLDAMPPPASSAAATPGQAEFVDLDGLQALVEQIEYERRQKAVDQQRAEEFGKATAEAVSGVLQGSSRRPRVGGILGAGVLPEIAAPSVGSAQARSRAGSVASWQSAEPTVPLLLQDGAAVTPVQAAEGCVAQLRSLSRQRRMRDVLRGDKSAALSTVRSLMDEALGTQTIDMASVATQTPDRAEAQSAAGRAGSGSGSGGNQEEEEEEEEEADKTAEGSSTESDDGAEAYSWRRGESEEEVEVEDDGGYARQARRKSSRSTSSEEEEEEDEEDEEEGSSGEGEYSDEEEEEDEEEDEGSVLDGGATDEDGAINLISDSDDD